MMLRNPQGGMSLLAKVYIVGAGPGDPDLITVRGLRILQEADVILYTNSLVRPELIERAKPGAEILESAGMDLERMVAVMAERIGRGQSVARIHTGDPSLFGAILEQVVLLRQAGVEVEIVPGVSSALAAAAALGAELTVPELTQTVIFTRVEGRTPVPERERLRDLAAHRCTLALFLSAAGIGRVVEELRAAGWPEETPVAAVYKATWPDQRIVRSTVGRIATDLQEAGIRSHAMILAGWALDPELPREGTARSRLYDPSFSHGYRRGGGGDG